MSGLHAYREANQITSEEFKALDELAFKLENRLLRLVETLERKKLDGEWIDSLIVKEGNENYGKGAVRKPITPTLHHSSAPTLR